MGLAELQRNIRAVIVDDEPLARSNLAVLLHLHSEISIVSECGSGMQALLEIRKLMPDLVFLDVEMPGSVVLLPDSPFDHRQARSRSRSQA